MSDDWKDCERPWTIDEFLAGDLKEAPVEWSTEAPTASGHYWIYREVMASVDVIEVLLGEAFLGLDSLSRRLPREKLLYGPRIPTIKAPK